ncbi:MAG TPA: response regulator [Actinomycetota bacterium]
MAPPILVVEDDTAHALLVERVFQKAGLMNPVVAFRDGREAAAYLAGDGPYSERIRHPLPVLVLLDNGVPGMSGLAVLSWIREQPGLEQLPVIMFSGSTESEDIDRAFQLGADSYLVKPVAFEALIDTVSGLGLPWILLDRRTRDD